MIRKKFARIFLAFSLIAGQAYGAAFQFGGLRLDAGAITSAAGTTTLSNASSQLQVVSGTTTQTVKLPDATTLQSGYWYDISNKSTEGIFVQNNGSVQLASVEPNQNVFLYVTSTATNGGVWDVQTAQASKANQDWKDACNWATTAALPAVLYSNGLLGIGATLTESGLGALSVDSGSPAVGDRVLVKNQASSLQNGIYSVTAVGSGALPFVLSRTVDYDTATDITAGTATYIVSGTVNGTSSWALTTTGAITVGSTGLTFGQIAGPGSLTAGTGISISGSTISLVTPVTVPNGGTGATTLTNHGVVIGQAASAVAVTSAGSSGQVLTSNGASSDPTFQAAAGSPTGAVATLLAGTGVGNTAAYTTASYPLTATSGSIMVSTATNAFSQLATADDNFILATSNSKPVWVVPKITNWATLTPHDLTFAGQGTVSSQTTYYRRVGDTAYVHGQFTSGTVAASNCNILLPGELKIDTTKMPSSNAGTAVGLMMTPASGGATNAMANGAILTIFYDGSTATNLYITYETGGNKYTQLNCSTMFNNSAPNTYYFEIPVSGWSANVNSP